VSQTEQTYGGPRIVMPDDDSSGGPPASPGRDVSEELLDGHVAEASDVDQPTTPRGGHAADPHVDRAGAHAESPGGLPLTQTGVFEPVTDAVVQLHSPKFSTSERERQAQFRATDHEAAYEGEVVRRYRAEDPPLYAPAEWKERVRAELDKRGVSQRDMAKAIGASPAGVSQALGETQHASKFVRAICAYLEIPEPMHEVDPEDLALLDALHTIERADPEISEHYRALILALAKSRGSKKP
jgi:transcriptional regulator with XRE-family HTH domain